MASDQLALTRAGRGNQVINPNKSTRQTVPAFLNKLYNMVNDESTAHLIKWSDEGDSFYVFNHEQFAREVLGRWFKHQNFSSFVRQLNMYGFHKIPHLQQGVLKTESETETWHFENGNFQRGQPDLLCLIQRKKQPNGPNDDGTHDSAAGGTGAAGQSAGGGGGGGQHASMSGGVLDVHNIVNGIAAIKRHQTAISDDLKLLQDSNQLLWQEAMDSRARHKKHQETINKILKFLAGVFNPNGPNADPSAPGTGPADGLAMVRRRPRLMISDGSGIDGTGASKSQISGDNDNLDRIELLGDDLDMTPAPVFSPAFGTPNVQTTPTPFNQPSPSPSVSTIRAGPRIVEHEDSPEPPPVQPTSPATPIKPEPRPFSTLPTPTPTPTNPQPPPSASTLTTLDPTLTTNPSQPLDTDAEVASAESFQRMLNSPDQFQRLLSLINGQQPIPTMPSFPSDLQLPDGLGSFGNTTNNQVAFPNGTISPNAALGLLASVDDGGVPGPDLNLLAQNDAQLQRSYKDAAAIAADVDTVQSHLYNLISDYGLEQHIASLLKKGGDVAHTDEVIDGGAGNDFSDPNLAMPDFDMDAFMHMTDDKNFDSLDWTGMQPNQAVIPPPKDGAGSLLKVPAGTGGAFLDEVTSGTSNASSSSPNALFDDLPEVLPIPDTTTQHPRETPPPAPIGAAVPKPSRKRKSDASLTESPQAKTRRKR